jgi:hypothetical protein
LVPSQSSSMVSITLSKNPFSSGLVGFSLIVFLS